jgi:hypothetical protein
LLFNCFSRSSNASHIFFVQVISVHVFSRSYHGAQKYFYFSMLYYLLILVPCKYQNSVATNTSQFTVTVIMETSSWPIPDACTSYRSCGWYHRHISIPTRGRRSQAHFRSVTPSGERLHGLMHTTCKLIPSTHMYFSQ